MADCMEFPKDWAKFLEDYSFCDHKEFYTNGARLIPVFRVEQMMHHYLRKATEDSVPRGVTVQEWISVKDRLPEKDGHYLCNYHFGEYPKMTFTQVLDYYATDIVPHFQHTLGDGSMKVTHWMEIPRLPEPPKRE